MAIPGTALVVSSSREIRIDFHPKGRLCQHPAILTGLNQAAAQAALAPARHTRGASDISTASAGWESRARKRVWEACGSNSVPTRFVAG